MRFGDLCKSTGRHSAISKGRREDRDSRGGMKDLELRAGRGWTKLVGTTCYPRRILIDLGSWITTANAERDDGLMLRSLSCISVRDGTSINLLLSESAEIDRYNKLIPPIESSPPLESCYVSVT